MSSKKGPLASIKTMEDDTSSTETLRMEESESDSNRSPIHSDHEQKGSCESLSEGNYADEEDSQNALEEIKVLGPKSFTSVQGVEEQNFSIPNTDTTKKLIQRSDLSSQTYSEPKTQAIIEDSPKFTTDSEKEKGHQAIKESFSGKLDVTELSDISDEENDFSDASDRNKSIEVPQEHCASIIVNDNEKAEIATNNINVSDLNSQTEKSEEKASNGIDVGVTKQLKETEEKGNEPKKSNLTITNILKFDFVEESVSSKNGHKDCPTAFLKNNTSGTNEMENANPKIKTDELTMKSTHAGKLECDSSLIGDFPLKVSSEIEGVENTIEDTTGPKVANNPEVIDNIPDDGESTKDISVVKTDDQKCTEETSDQNMKLLECYVMIELLPPYLIPDENSFIKLSKLLKKNLPKNLHWILKNSRYKIPAKEAIKETVRKSQRKKKKPEERILVARKKRKPPKPRFTKEEATKSKELNKPLPKETQEVKNKNEKKSPPTVVSDKNTRTMKVSKKSKKNFPKNDELLEKPGERRNPRRQSQKEQTVEKSEPHESSEEKKKKGASEIKSKSKKKALDNIPSGAKRKIKDSHPNTRKRKRPKY